MKIGTRATMIMFQLMPNCLYFGHRMKKTITVFCLMLTIYQVPAETIRDIRIVNQAGESYGISSVVALHLFRWVNR